MAYDPSMGLYWNLARSGLIDRQDGDANFQGTLNPAFVAAIESAYQRGGDINLGGEGAFNLISGADAARSYSDPMGYAQELMQGSGVQAYSSQDEMNQYLNTARHTGTMDSIGDALGGAVSTIAGVPGDLLKNPGVAEFLTVAGLGAGMGSGLFGGGGSSVAGGTAAGAADASGLAGLLESGAVGTAGGAMETAALGGGVDYAAALAGGGAGSAPAISGAALTAPAAAAGGSTLANFMNGSGTPADWMNLAGTVGITGLGMYGAGKQADALTDIANQSRADRAPFLGKANEWLSNPQAYIDGPGMASMDATLKRLSASRGNPIDSPTALGLATQAGMQDWRNAVTGFANIGLSGEDSRNSMMAGAAGADAEGLNALGYGIGELTKPKKLTLADVLGRQYGLS